MRCRTLLFLLLAVTAAACSANQFKQPLTLADGTVVSVETLDKGHEGYNLYCVACHGEKGDGRGPSAPGLRPPPRDFTQGLFEFGGVPIPSTPPDAELVRSVRSGRHGTALPPSDIRDAELTNILQYIKTFAPQKWTRKDPVVGTPLAIRPDPFGEARRAEAIELGKKLYHARAQCSTCHPSYVTHSQVKQSEYCLKWEDESKPPADRSCAVPVPVVPPDFTRDPLRGVRLARATGDLYRTIASGTSNGALEEEELWGLVHYVKSLAALSDPLDPDAAKKYRELRARLDAPSNAAWVPPPEAPPAPATPAARGAPAPAATK